MDTHPDIVRAISTALGAVAGSLTGDRTKGPKKESQDSFTQKIRTLTTKESPT